MDNEKIIMDLQTKGTPFMINFEGEGSIFFGTDQELKTLMVLAISSRTKTDEERQKWIDDLSEASTEYADTKEEN